MKQPIFTGSSVAIVTPFRDGNIDYEKLAQLLDYQISNGTAAITICGTTGESSTQTLEEHMAAVEYTIKYVNGRCKVIAGAGSNDTQAALMLSQHADKAGADGLLLVTPYYNKATQKGLIQHYTYIADRVNTPIILYNVPGRTGCGFTVDTYKALSKHPMINGVKEASGNVSQVARTVAACGDDLNIWSGNDDQIVALMALGAKGVISVLANICPKETAKIAQLCLDGNFAEAAKMQCDYMQLIDALFCEVNPIPIKTAMNLMGFDVGPLRLPLCDMEEKNLNTLKAALTAKGLL
jgi:4-hydroxy-tetrahydrodipicolinate synthase